MEDIVIAIIRDLPSTAVLILFVWFTSKQFQQALALLSEHLAAINKLLERCIGSKKLEERERELDYKLDLVNEMLRDVKSLKNQ